MHLILGTRGIQQVIDMWHTGMQGTWFPWKRKNLKTGQDEFTSIQLSLRPIQFWDIVFPAEHLDSVLNSLGIKAGGKTEPTILNAYTGIMRKMFGLKPIPDEIKPAPTFPVFKEHINFIPVGIKEDKIEDCIFPDGACYHQERL